MKSIFTALRRGVLLAVLCLTGTISRARAEIDTVPNSGEKLARGKYLITISGCNDCHTAGYGPSNGEVPEEQWLMGDSVGWRGPWGTTYPINLRRFASLLTEDQWLQTLKSAKARPPMPWITLHRMQDEDLRAMYAYIKSLQPPGEEAPLYLPPEQEPSTPYFILVVPEPKS